MAKKYSKEFLKKIPKADLHVHLDGSLRVSTLIELARDAKIKLPSKTESGLKETVFKEKYKSLIEYLQGFAYTTAVMQTPEALERVAYEFAIDNFEEGVRYVEPRFAPQQHVSPSYPIEDVLYSVDAGFSRAKKEINSLPAIKSGKEPPFEYGILCCAMRMFTREFSGYYKRFVNLHPHMPDDDLYGLASLDLVRSMVFARDKYGLPIAGLDLAGAEKGFPAVDHRHAFELAQQHFFKKTIHAGEAYGPPSIFQAIVDCHADRIGHGTHLFDGSMVDLPTQKEKKAYVQALWEYIADRRITIEVCLTSNLQTMPKLKSVKNHPVAEMLDKRISVTFCTDNRLVSRTTATNELELAVSNFDIEPKKLKDIVIYGFKRNFYSGEYLKKRKYVRKVIDYYESVEKEFNI